MALIHWHRGKIILLWIWTVVLMSGAFGLFTTEGSSPWKLPMFVFMIVAPIAMSVITWKWLGCLEDRTAITEGLKDEPTTPL